MMVPVHATFAEKVTVIHNFYIQILKKFANVFDVLVTKLLVP